MAMPGAPATAPAARPARRARRRSARARTPIARCTPMAGRRRWTSAAVVAASIVAAAPRATSEKATSSAMTIPAAESMSTRTPLRVTKRTPRTWVLVARACCSRTSTRPGSAAQISAWSTGKRCRASRLEPRARDVHARGRGEREGDVVGCHRDPHHVQRPQPPDLHVVAHARRATRWPPRARSRPRCGAPVDVAPGHDRVAARGGRVDQRDAALLRRAAVAATPTPVNSRRYGATGDVRAARSRCASISPRDRRGSAR